MALSPSKLWPGHLGKGASPLRPPSSCLLFRNHTPTAPTRCLPQTRNEHEGQVGAVWNLQVENVQLYLMAGPGGWGSIRALV